MKHDLSREEFAERLRKMIEALGKRPSHVAREVEASQGNLSAILNRQQHSPSWSIFVNMVLEYPQLNPLYMLYGEGQGVLRENVDFMPVACKQSNLVLTHIMSQQGATFEILINYEGLEDVKEVAAYERNFKMKELRALHRLFPEYSVFWLMTSEAPVLDAAYAMLQLKCKR